MIDRKWIGHDLGTSVLPIERTRLKFFAKAIGETDPVYTDEAAARGAGYPDLPAPPTFLFAAGLDSGSLDRMLADLGVPIERILHGEQGFRYYRPVCVGDTITVKEKIADIYDKKNGAMEFIVKTAQAHNQHGESVAELRMVIVVRN
ncbi:MaoC family dehydratase N-terminal domain-containing protein [Cupriavidus pinatubonensis]|uniref:MaoC family dehydratase N-terminal domain-containing protein n=1 Tax=Cupriavidus pinatubonensis TaxID=248026 RepID=UPI00112CBDA4|nr:MaoC family dehydratase N-terminal domain-containing protein [Cupriavidus pinatubonensis]TPQ33975.1 MaoC family dehydratase [Cupriavidus pinatubonensis]